MELIQLRKIPQDIRDFLTSPYSISKNIAYNKTMKYRLIEDSNLVWKEGKLHYAYSSYKLCKGKSHYYLRKSIREGFTLDEKGKLKLWFGKSRPFEINGLDEALLALKVEWIHRDMFPFLTKGLLERILTKKITNPIDFFKYYLKSVRVKASPKYMYQAVTLKGMKKAPFLRAAAIATDANAYINLYLKENPILASPELNDLESQCVILDRKINYRWSVKRLHAEHQECTHILMKEELDGLEDKDLPHLKKFSIEGLELLDTKKKIFLEGSVMKHCIYTSYYESIEKGRYVAYHVDYNGESGTVGANLTRHGLLINQIRGVRNDTCSGELSQYVHNKIQEVNVNIRGVIVEDVDFDVLLQEVNF